MIYLVPRGTSASILHMQVFFQGLFLRLVGVAIVGEIKNSMPLPCANTYSYHAKGSKQLLRNGRIYATRNYMGYSHL
jgi:hypothetical protein